MLQIEIDGKQVSVEQGATVIEAAHKLGTYIPHFCYHKNFHRRQLPYVFGGRGKSPQTPARLCHAGYRRHDCAYAFGKAESSRRRDGVLAHQPSA